MELKELLKGPVVSDGIKGKRVWDFSKKQKKGDVIDLFATEKEFSDDLYSIGQNFIKNDPRFNLELAIKFRNPGTTTYSAHGSGKLHSPAQRQQILDNLKKVMKHDTYQARHADELSYVDLTDDIFTIEKASGGRIGRYEGGIAPLVGEPSYAADFYDDRMPMKKGNRALTNVQNEFLKMQLANNPEFKAEYFPNIINEGPVSQYERNVPYDTPGSRINVRNLPPDYDEEIHHPGVQRFDVASIAARDRGYFRGEPTEKGYVPHINVNPDILASYGTAPSSPRNEMVPTPEWFKKIGRMYDFETGPTVDQATLNDTIEHILSHETGHGVSGLKPYLSDTGEAESFDFSEFLSPNIKQSKEIRDRYDVSKLIRSGEIEAYSFMQEELFNRMKDIERLKRAHPDDYKDHPLWDLYDKRAKIKFAELTDQDPKNVKRFDKYKKKIKPYVDSYFEKVEKKGSGIASINIEKEDIEMPEHLTQAAQGGRIGLGGGGGIIKLLKKFLKKKPKKDVIKPFEFPDVGIGSDFHKKVLDDMLKSKSRLKDFDPKGKPHAEGGRIGLAGGGVLKKFIEKLFYQSFQRHSTGTRKMERSR